eukprot:403374835
MKYQTTLSQLPTATSSFNPPSFSIQKFEDQQNRPHGLVLANTIKFQTSVRQNEQENNNILSHNYAFSECFDIRQQNNQAAKRQKGSPKKERSNGGSDDYSKRKVGRPFKGKVDEQGKEPNVPERRSVLRAFKKFYAKKEYDKVSDQRKDNFMQQATHNLTNEEILEIYNYMNKCKQTQSADHYKKKKDFQVVSEELIANVAKNEILTPASAQMLERIKTFTPQQNTEEEEPKKLLVPSGRCKQLQVYDPLIGDPCYRYNKAVKEKFFKNPFLSYLYLFFVYQSGAIFVEKQQSRTEVQESIKHAILNEIIWEFSKLALKTLERNQDIHPGFHENALQIFGEIQENFDT